MTKAEIEANIKEVDKDLDWNKGLIEEADRAHDTALLKHLTNRRLELLRARAAHFLALTSVKD